MLVDKHITFPTSFIIAYVFLTSTFVFADSIIYTYDDINRLHQVQYGSGAIITYDYDEVGNRTQRNNSIPGMASISLIPFGCGTVTKPVGDPNFTTGSSPIYGFQANTGSRIVDIQVDGVSQGAIASYTFNNLIANHTLMPFFSFPNCDADSSGVVDVADALVTLRAVVGLIPTTPQILAKADVAPLVNGYPAPDGKVDVSDALAILRRVVGLVTWNTVCGSSQQSLAAAAPMAATTTLTAASMATALSAAPTSSASIAIIPSGNGAYTVQGTNMSGIGGVQMTIAYDTATLGSPSLTLGSLASGAMLIADTTTKPGSITIGIISASGFAGTGPIAVVNFASWNGTSAVPTFQRYGLSDVNSNMLSTFDINHPVIAVSTSGCGTVSPAGPVVLNKGGSQTFTFQASTGSYLADVKVDGVSVGIVPSYSFTNVTANRTIQAAFIIPDGDINNNGVVDSTDNNLALRIAVKLDPQTPLALAHGDVAPLVNGVPAPNGVVDISDALQISRKVSGQISWNTVCVPAQQGLSAATLAVSSSTSTTATLLTPSATTKQATSCSDYYKLYDEPTLMGIIPLLEHAEAAGKDGVINGNRSIVARKVTNCGIDIQFYNDVKQKNLLCTERITTCASGN